MYEADKRTIESGVSGLQLMEAAGSSIAREIQKRWSPRKTVILCGPGNNGGDGFVVARLLHQKGWSVDILLLGERDNLKGDAKENADRWPFETFHLSPENLERAELIVDAVFGAGLARDVDGLVADTLTAACRMNVPIVGVDTPSGVDGQTGQIRGTSLKADLTVTFARAKYGHYLFPGKDYCGDLIISDIGISDKTVADLNCLVERNNPAQLFPWPENDIHKYKRGHGLILGGQRMTGASRLAALSARRVGAGLITIAAKGTAYMIYRQADAGNIVSDEDFDILLSDPRKNAVLAGPGLGISKRRTGKIKTLLHSDKSLVLDADALTMMTSLDKLPQRNGETLLTPHEGEFSRLFPQLTGSKLEKASRAAQQTGYTILLKGPDTVIAHPDGRARINTSGTPWLATAGSGDCLAGICLGLMCQGLDAFDAGSLAAWLHGKCAEHHGAGLIAEDIPVILPKVLNSLQK
ncbi:MAG: NAD(P)H-hydrate dehydratase [Methylocystaceae bacterium]|nr:NAD(P)H-hydrate dehydratase [Methylocystaceae bacterium]